MIGLEILMIGNINDWLADIDDREREKCFI